MRRKLRALSNQMRARAGHRNSLRRRLLTGGAGTIVVKSLGGAFAFLISIFLARVLSPAGLGTYALAQSVIGVLAVPAQLGLPQLVVRETSKALERREWGLMKGIWIWSHVITIALGSAILLAIYLATTIESQRWDESFRKTLLASAPLLIFMSLGNIRGAALRGLRFTVYGQLPEFVIRPFVFMLILLLSMLAARAGMIEIFGPEQAAYALLAASFVAFLAGGVFLLRLKPEFITKALAPSFEHGAWARTALPLAISGGMQAIIHQIDTMLVGAFNQTEDVGVYRVAVAAAGFMSFILASVNMVVAPHFAALYANADWGRLKRLVKISSRIVAGISVPMLLLLAVWAEQLIVLLYGAEYVPGALPLRILLVGQAFNILTGPVGTLLNMTGNEAAYARGIYIAFAANIVLACSLIPVWGVVGAAVTTAATIILSNLLQYRAVVRRFGYGCSPF